jgi:hypothetical protein
LRNDRRGYQGLDGAAFHLVGVHVGRILNCEAVADLPVQQSTTVALTLNFETAKTLGREVSLRGNVFDPHRDDIAASQLAINGEIEHCQLASSPFDLKLPNGPSQLLAISSQS